MKRLLFGAIALTMAVSPLAATAAPKHSDHGQQSDHDQRDRDDQYNHASDPGGKDHHDRGLHRGWGREYDVSHHWRRGERMGYENWRSAQPIDYRQHHLRAPPRGYEWRQSNNGQYVLAAIATGLILSIITGGR